MAEIQRMSHKHVDILNYLIANPLVRLGDVARHFEMTQGWLSQVIHSDAFQRMMSEKQDAVFHTSVLPLKEKMTAIAHKALDKLDDKMEIETDTAEIRQVAETVLDRIGFNTKTAPVVHNTLNQFISVERERLAKARSLIGTRQPVLLEHSNALQAPAPHLVGGSQEPSPIPSPPSAHSRAEEGS